MFPSRFLPRTKLAKALWVLVALEIAGAAASYVGLRIQLTVVHVGLIVVLFLLSVGGIRWVAGKVLWRVRNRLLVTYLFVGVVPILLIGTMILAAAYLLMGQTAAYLAVSNLERRIEVTQNVAHDFGLNFAYLLRMEKPEEAARQLLDDVHSRLPGLELILKTGNSTLRLPADSRLAAVPEWSTPGFTGTVDDGERYYIAAHVQVRADNRSLELFAYEPIDAQLLAGLLPEIGVIRLFGRPSGAEDAVVVINPAGTSTVRVPPGGQFGVVLDSSAGRPLPAARAFWDLPTAWFTIISARRVKPGSGEAASINLPTVVETRPSLIVGRLLSVSGQAGFIVIALLGAAAIAFFVVEVVALIGGAGLTRSITRSVHDLYEGTERVRAGDLSHRIPVRSSDQLSELASSFNTMTEQVQRLIVEVKEKEKLESELEIAREVQAQFFPKQIPQLKTLELQGVCNPARTVSGDYYDFFKLSSQWTALAIGDISGKGISAAILMASLRSLLHAQLKLPGHGRLMPEDEWMVSTADLIGRINEQLFESTPAEKYATLYCGLYDDTSGRLIYTNAGHLPPLLVRGNTVMPMHPTGTIVGAFPGMMYERDQVNLQIGDLIVAYTDGVTEAANDDEEEFGVRRLTDYVLRHRDRPLEEILSGLTDQVRDWTRTDDLQDDTTLILARRI